jgi:elongation factor G
MNVRTGKIERLGRLLEMHADQRTDLKELRAGDIGAVIGAKLRAIIPPWRARS